MGYPPHEIFCMPSGNGDHNDPMRVGAVNWVTIVTAAVAVYGAILSTYNAFSKWAEDRRTVQVGLRYGIYPENPKLFLSAVNAGKRPVFLHKRWLSLSNKKKIEYNGMHYIGEPFLPVQLTEGNSCEYWTPARGLAAHLKESGLSGTIKLVAFFQDSMGVHYRSKPLRFEIETYLPQEAAAAESDTTTWTFDAKKDNL
jgi:hypothetical protein